ncbi:hypothetical protein FALCPG4_005600 [Fusarium falciforme]
MTSTWLAPPLFYSKRLAPNEIRLMALLPGRWSDPISCQLGIDSLLKKERRSDYKALSYAWGLRSRSDPPHIRVQDTMLPITVNLECALRQLRLPDEPLILWVDAICINQANVFERTTQVSRMADIYSEATEVIVFLGGGPGRQMKSSEKHKDSGPCIVFTNTSLDDSLTKQALLNWTTPGRRKPITPFDLFCLLRVLSQPRKTSHPFEPLREVPDVYLTVMFEGLRQMLTARWWDRIWVVQEAVIAKKITLRYGGVSAPWEMLADAASTHFQRAEAHYASPVPRDDVKVLNLLSRVQDIDSFRRAWGENEKPKILSLLREFSNRKASDERDKVYALLGLCDQDTGIRPDYSSEVRETYMLATIDIILHSRSLSVLTGDLGRKERRDLPSWVPDWSATFDEHDRKRVRLFNHYNTCGDARCSILEHDKIGGHIEDEITSLAMSLELTHPTYRPPGLLSEILMWYKSAHPEARSACDRLIACCRSDDQLDIEPWIDYSIVEFEPLKWEGCLKVSGCCIGTVEKTMPPLYSSSDMDAVSDAITAWHKHAELSQPLDFRRNDFVSTILSGVKKTPNGFERLGADDELAISYWYRCRIEKEDLDWPDPDLAPPTPETLDGFTEAMRLSVTNRTFFIIRGGKMGLGPASIAKGDEIHALPGGKLPLVLRSVKPPEDLDPWPHVLEPTTYNLVGDCFLDGAMDYQLGSPRPAGLPAKFFQQVADILQNKWENCRRKLRGILGLQAEEWPGELEWPEITQWDEEHLRDLRYYLNGIYEGQKLPKGEERPGGRGVLRVEYEYIIKRMNGLSLDWAKLTRVGLEIEKRFMYLV